MIFPKPTSLALRSPRALAACRGELMAVTDPGNPLLRLSHVALLPHAAWLTPQTFARSLGAAVAGSRCLPDGGALRRRVV